MLCFGVLAPHAPILLPEIGGAEAQKVKKTIKALERAGKNLAKRDPDKVIIISPHTEHGFYVPWYFLGNALKNPEAEEILVTNPSYEYYFALGKRYAQKIAASPQKIAIIASGDLSHVLKEDGPYGFNPAGPKLDKIICEAIQNRDLKTLLNLDPSLLDEGAECGLRSLIFLMSAFEEQKYQSNLLSYEGPFGVGYCVATFEVKEEK